LECREQQKDAGEGGKDALHSQADMLARRHGAIVTLARYCSGSEKHEAAGALMRYGQGVFHSVYYLTSMRAGEEDERSPDS
jgi:hypothetical protein